MNITERLFELQDVAYADFQAKLTPGIDRSLFIGVRVPQTRSLAKYIWKEETKEDIFTFLHQLPHHYYDENMLHGILISEMKDYESCIEELERFLPYVDNWAVCDIMSPKVFRKYRERLLEKIKEWISSKHVYTCRFAMEMLMSHFLEEEFDPQYIEMVASVSSEEYYINMMIAWYMATALAKQWEATIPYLEQRQLSDWVHAKTIQKAVESYRISDEQKTYLRSLRK